MVLCPFRAPLVPFHSISYCRSSCYGQGWQRMLQFLLQCMNGLRRRIAVSAAGISQLTSLPLILLNSFSSTGQQSLGSSLWSIALAWLLPSIRILGTPCCQPFLVTGIKQQKRIWFTLGVARATNLWEQWLHKQWSWILRLYRAGCIIACNTLPPSKPIHELQKKL